MQDPPKCHPRTEVTVIKVYQTQKLPYSLTANWKGWTHGGMEGLEEGQSRNALQRARRGCEVESLALTGLVEVKQAMGWHLNRFRHSL